jgi:hypothetical protein
MPRKVDPKEAAKRRQKHRYAPLRAMLMEIVRAKGMTPVRAGFEKDHLPGSAILALDRALALWRTTGTRPPNLDVALFGVQAANVEDRREGLEPPVEFSVRSDTRVQTRTGAKRRGRRPKRSTWLDSLPDVLREIWLDNYSAFPEFEPILIGKRVVGASPVFRRTPRSELAYRARSRLVDIGFNPRLRAIETAIDDALRVRSLLEDDVTEYGETLLFQSAPATVAAGLRLSADLRSQASPAIREAGVRKALVDLTIPLM